jgi:hypothetical protein
LFTIIGVDGNSSSYIGFTDHWDKGPNIITKPPKSRKEWRHVLSLAKYAPGTAVPLLLHPSCPILVWLLYNDVESFKGPFTQSLK